MGITVDQHRLETKVAGQQYLYGYKHEKSAMKNAAEIAKESTIRALNGVIAEGGLGKVIYL